MRSLASRVTTCCNSEVVRASGRQYPDGRTFYISTSYDICLSCNQEWPETFAYRCDFCGEGTNWVVETDLGEYCRECAESESQ